MIVIFVSGCCQGFENSPQLIILCVLQTPQRASRESESFLLLLSSCTSPALKDADWQVQGSSSCTGAISHLDFPLQDSSGSQHGSWPEWHWSLTLNVEGVNMGRFSFIYMLVCCCAFANLWFLQQSLLSGFILHSYCCCSTSILSTFIPLLFFSFLSLSLFLYV